MAKSICPDSAINEVSVLSTGGRPITRNGHDWTTRYPLIVEPALKSRQKQFVIDGVAVILGVGSPLIALQFLLKLGVLGGGIEFFSAGLRLVLVALGFVAARGC